MNFSLKSSAVAALTALSIAAVPAAPAQAWGDKEQGFVAGVAAAVIIDEILKQNRKARATPPAPAPVYVAPTHTSIYATPAARAFNSYSRGERKAIQRSLRSMGYYHGGIDGDPPWQVRLPGPPCPRQGGPSFAISPVRASRPR